MPPVIPPDAGVVGTLLRLGGLKQTPKWQSAGAAGCEPIARGEQARRPVEQPASSGVEGGVQTVRVDDLGKCVATNGGFAFSMRQVTQAVYYWEEADRKLDTETLKKEGTSPEPRAQLTLHGGGRLGVGRGLVPGSSAAGQGPWY